MKSRRAPASAPVPASVPAPAGAGAEGVESTSPKAERSASAGGVDADGESRQRQEITDLVPKFHQPVFAYSGEGDEGVLARRVPEGWWIRDSDEVPLGWKPVAWGQPD